jgi:phosphatidylserine/phosphatidylglycerophosphate/cardiolipin synthase-like enzyme/membrane protein DedA with SNARE-associated domain
MQSILRPGKNCTAVAHAARVALLVDAAAYFRAFHRAALKAERSITILGWDFDSRTPLHLDETRRGDPPALLGDFLNWLARRRRSLQIRVLNWDYPAVYGTDRETRPLYGFGWSPHRRVHLRYDDTHPFAGSQHQKIAVIDDTVAFAGGIDMALKRWDTPEHLGADPRRRVDGKPYPPVHDLMIAVDGKAAGALGDVARARWLRATGEKLKACRPPKGDPWPQELAVDIEDVDVGIAQTLPPEDGKPAVREVEALYLDMIAAAKSSIYIENQYFTSPVIADALAGRLGEPGGPEVLLVLRLLSHGWLEEHTMHVLRTTMLKRLIAADRHGRLRVCYPHVPGLAEGCCVDVHSKLMIVDDDLLRIGSSNIANRSMGVDAECDLLVEARGRDELRKAIAGFRARLLAEHMACEAGAVREQAGMCAAVDALSCKERCLKKLEDIPEWPEAVIELASVADPNEPIVKDFTDLAPPAPHEEPAQRPAWGKLAVLVAVIAALTALWRFTPLAEMFSAQQAVEWAKEFGNRPWAPWVVMLSYTPACFLLFPRPLVTLAAVIAFGPWLGFAVALGGVVLSSGVTYYAGRFMRRDTVRRLAGARLDRMIEVLRKHGLLAMTLLRLVPLAPFAIEGIVAGAVRLKLWHLLAGTAIGMLPGTLATTVFGEQIEAAVSGDRGVNWWVIFGVGALLVGGTWAVRRWFRRMAGGSAGAGAGAAAPRQGEGALAESR